MRTSRLLRFWPVLGGALAGIVLRLIFSGAPGGNFSAMAGPFIYLAPLVVSAASLFLDRKTPNQTWSRYFQLGAYANGFFVLGTLLILIEGLICAVVIVPLFMVYGGLYGLLVGAFFRWTKWPKSSVNGFAILPVVLALVSPEREHSPIIDSIERTVTINAPAEKIWPILLDAPDIKPSEVEHGWIYRIGVPLPLEGRTKRLGNELVRELKLGKSVYFDLRSTNWKENEYVTWSYRFYEDSFPPRALDDHVKIGGHYFDLIDTTYSLESTGPETTQLKIKIRYRVSTDFDWYANLAAQILIGNFGKVALGFYQHRAEAL